MINQIKGKTCNEARNEIWLKMSLACSSQGDLIKLLACPYCQQIDLNWKIQGLLLWVTHGNLTACSWPRHGSSPLLNGVAKVVLRCCRYFITLCWWIGVIMWTYHWSKSSQVMFRLLNHFMAMVWQKNCHGHPTGIFGIINHTWTVLYLYVKGNILFDATIRKDYGIQNLFRYQICYPSQLGPLYLLFALYGCA